MIKSQLNGMYSLTYMWPFFIPISASFPDHHSLIPGIILAVLAVHLSFIWNRTLEWL